MTYLDELAAMMDPDNIGPVMTRQEIIRAVRDDRLLPEIIIGPPHPLHVMVPPHEILRELCGYGESTEFHGLVTGGILLITTRRLW